MTAESTLPDNRLFEWYRTYIGEPDERTDVYLGFGLFFGGVVLGVLALVSFIWAGTFEARTDPYFLRALLGYSLGMLSLPAAMLGIVVLLPVERRAFYASVGGAAITALAVGLFVWAYPENWNGYGADYTMQITAVYALGVAVDVAATGAALVAHQLQRARPSPGDVEPVGESEPGESYSDDEIERDIEEAMADVEISWGGVRKVESKRLEFDFDESGIDRSGLDIEPETVRMESTDAQVQGLKQLKGEESNTASGEGVSNQTRKLNELREQRRAEERKRQQASTGLFARFRERIGLN